MSPFYFQGASQDFLEPFECFQRVQRSRLGLDELSDAFKQPWIGVVYRQMGLRASVYQ